MLRAISIFVKDRVVHSSAGLQDFDSALLDNTKSISMSPTDKSRYVSTSFPPTLPLETQNKSWAFSPAPVF